MFCPECDDWVSYSYNLERHQKSNLCRKRRRQKLYCDECDLYLDSRVEFDIHKRICDKLQYIVGEKDKRITELMDENKKLKSEIKTLQSQLVKKASVPRIRINKVDYNLTIKMVPVLNGSCDKGLLKEVLDSISASALQRRNTKNILG